MNLTFTLIAASIFLSSPARAPQADAAGPITLQRTYEVGHESAFVLTMSQSTQWLLKAKIHVKTVALLADGKASQEMTAGDIVGLPPDASAPEKATWTFDKNGMAAENFVVNSGRMLYSILSMMSYVPGTIVPGKEFKVDWASPDKSSKNTGTGAFQSANVVKGVHVLVLKTNLEVTPTGESKATVHNTATFDAATGILVSANGTVEVDGKTMTLTVTSS